MGQLWVVSRVDPFTREPDPVSFSPGDGIRDLKQELKKRHHRKFDIFEVSGDKLGVKKANLSRSISAGDHVSELWAYPRLSNLLPVAILKRDGQLFRPTGKVFQIPSDLVGDPQRLRDLVSSLCETTVIKLFLHRNDGRNIEPGECTPESVSCVCAATD
jgi:hypothetical protein